MGHGAVEQKQGEFGRHDHSGHQRVLQFAAHGPERDQQVQPSMRYDWNGCHGQEANRECGPGSMMKSRLCDVRLLCQPLMPDRTCGHRCQREDLLDTRWTVECVGIGK